MVDNVSDDGYVQCSNKGCEAWYPQAWGECPICSIEEAKARITIEWWQEGEIERLEQAAKEWHEQREYSSYKRKAR